MKSNAQKYTFRADESFAREPFEKELDAALREQDVIALRKRMQKVMEPDKQVRFTPFATWLSVAAVVCVGIFLWLQPFDSQDNHRSLYSKYYQTYSIHGVVRGEVAAEDAENQAALAYANGNYALARTLFYREYQQDESNYKALFYLALSCMELNQYQEAKAYWGRLEKDNPKVLFADAIAWYHALTLIKTNDVEKAKHLLSGLSSYETAYAKRAESLLEDL
jgi:tetratricopeptide (TPR) repeat protein